MNKFQRAQKRIKKDKKREESKIYSILGDNPTDNIFTYVNYLNKFSKCKLGVNWKQSVQLYEFHIFTEIYKTINKVRSGTIPPLLYFKQITIRERGKERLITPVDIRDRMTQRVICDCCLLPLIKDKLIYDNGASLEGKGVQKSRDRMEHHVRKAIKEYGSDFYILSFDFKSYFDSIPHLTCYKVLKKVIQNDTVVGMIMNIVKSYHRAAIMKIKNALEREKQLKLLDENKLCGICLGSQISQILALLIPNQLDHYIKDKVGVKHYVRYMDDGIILSKSKEFLKELYEKMKEICNELGLKFSEKKTHITTSHKGFKFLKIRYFVTSTGKLIKKLSRETITRSRRRLNKLKGLLKEGRTTLDRVYASAQSRINNCNLANGYRTKRSFIKQYNNLFDGYKITRKHKYLTRGKEGKNGLLQVDKWYEYRWSYNGG